ncbi:MAG: hypothetical protein Q8O34_17750 [Rhodocyclaceae bacterium]|nr:hypothetical protein [Rhodocyclaceae bacterium]
MEVLPAAKFIGDPLDEAGAFPAIHCDATQGAHQRTKRAVEHRVLAYPVRAEGQRGEGQQRHRKIPVRGVRIGDHDRLGRSLWQIEQLPAQKPENEAGGAAQQAHRVFVARRKRLRPGSR